MFLQLLPVQILDVSALRVLLIVYRQTLVGVYVTVACYDCTWTDRQTDRLHVDVCIAGVVVVVCGAAACWRSRRLFYNWDNQHCSLLLVGRPEVCNTRDAAKKHVESTHVT